MRQLIVNADGFGFTSGINKGIMESIADGIVTSTSCNVNFPAISEIGALSALRPGVSIGLHLNVNVGKPVLPPSEVPSLVNAQGEFWGRDFTSHYLLGKIRLSDIERELDAQIRKLKSYGVAITHLDGHQNKHLFPGYFDTVLRLGEKHGIKRIRCHRRYLFVKDVHRRTRRVVWYYATHPQRLLSHSLARLQMRRAENKGFRMADRLITPAYVDKSFKYSLETWIGIVNSLPEGTSEIYCHPGYSDSELRKYAKYTEEREIEIKVLTDARLRRCIEDAGIRLIGFSEIGCSG